MKVEATKNALYDICGQDIVISLEDGKISTEVDGKNITIDLNSMQVICPDDMNLQHLLSAVVQKLTATITPIS